MELFYVALFSSLRTVLCSYSGRGHGNQSIRAHEVQKHMFSPYGYTNPSLWFCITMYAHPVLQLVSTYCLLACCLVFFRRVSIAWRARAYVRTGGARDGCTQQCLAATRKPCPCFSLNAAAVLVVPARRSYISVSGGNVLL